MKKNYFGVVLLVFLLLVCFSGLAYCVVETQDGEGYVTRLSSPGKLEIVAHPAADTYYARREPLKELRKFDLNADNFFFQMDYASRDLSVFNISTLGMDIFYARFDTKTKWPKDMPEYFNPQSVMEQAKNPGLGVRALNRQGISGENIGIAIIDNNPLLVDHQEYINQLKLYEEIHFNPEWDAQMHAPAVASIAVGKTIGVAPKADLYYIAVWPGVWKNDKMEVDYTYTGKAIERILEINMSLPKDKKIRVISISDGWDNKVKGFAYVEAAIEKAKADNIFVITSYFSRDYPGMEFDSLGRKPYANPDDVNSYDLWSAFQCKYEMLSRMPESLLVPSDAKTTASPVGVKDYVYYGIGGRSWSIPWLAGMYALACQVNAQVNPQQFWQAALATSTTIDVEYNSKNYKLGKIINPQKLIETLRK